MPHERTRFQLATVPGAIEGKTGDAEPAVARSSDGKSVTLLAADAGSQIAVHELDDRPPLAQATLDLQPIHVVGEADVGGPSLDRVERRLGAVVRDGELRKPIGGGVRKWRRLGIAMDDGDLVTARGQTACDSIEIALDPSRIAEPIVGDQDPHQIRTPAALSARSTAIVWRRSKWAS